MHERGLSGSLIEQEVISKPIGLDIHLPLGFIDSQRLKMVGLVSTLTLLTAGCTSEQHQAFYFGLGGFVVNTALTYANLSIWSEGKFSAKVKAGISAAAGVLGCIDPGIALTECVLSSLFMVRGVFHNWEMKEEIKKMGISDGDEE